MLRGHEKPPELMKVEVMKVLPYISEREEVDILIKECCDPEDDEGFMPFKRKCGRASAHAQSNAKKRKIFAIFFSARNS